MHAHDLPKGPTADNTRAEPARLVEEFELITPDGRWHRFRKFTRAEILENRLFTVVAVAFSAAFWLLLLWGIAAQIWR